MPCLVDKRTLDTLVGGAGKYGRGVKKVLMLKTNYKTKTKTKNFQTPIKGAKKFQTSKRGVKKV